MVTLAACSPTAQADSESDRTSHDPHPERTVEGSPAVSIGGESSGLEGDLYGARGVTRLSDGRIVVADGAQRLVFFDAAGRYLQSDRVRWDALQWNVPEGHALPAITDVGLDEDGNLWMGEHRAHDDPFRIWHVFGPTGSYLAKAVTPADFRPFTVEKEVVLGVSRDDLDGEHVQLRRIART